MCRSILVKFAALEGLVFLVLQGEISSLLPAAGPGVLIDQANILVRDLQS